VATYTADQLQRLLDIRARGVLTVRDADGRSTTYQSGADLDRAIAAAKRDIAAAAGTPRAGRHYLEHGRG